MKIFVGKIPNNIGKEKLRILFSDYGEVKEVDVLIEIINGEWEAFAFVNMPNENEAWDAISALDNKVHFGNTLSVHQARYLDNNEKATKKRKGRRESDFPNR